jgi:hypothetical protein
MIARFNLKRLKIKYHWTIFRFDRLFFRSYYLFTKMHLARGLSAQNFMTAFLMLTIQKHLRRAESLFGPLSNQLRP